MANLHRHASSIAATMIGTILVSGCIATETRWMHEDIPSNEWGVDAAQCRWESERKAGKEAEEDMAYGADEALGDGQSVDTMFASADRDNRARELFDRCMRSLGYVPAE